MISESKYYFTVFTPTYNRAYTLARVYDCLCAQTLRDFEWLIVDDGSTDSTAELVQRWKDESRLPIRYIFQANQGKHRAFNRGVLEARGEMFVALDSDDACLPNSLERLRFHWEEIPVHERADFSGVTVLCIDDRGRIVGDAFPGDNLDLSPIEMSYKHSIRGEKWGMHKTATLRQFPFPELEDEPFVPEGIVWNRIGRKYKIRFVNEALRIYHSSSDGLSHSLSRVRMRSPRGTRLFYVELLRLVISPANRIRAVCNYIRYSLHCRLRFGEIVVGAPTPLLTIVCFPIGWFLKIHDVRGDR